MKNINIPRFYGGFYSWTAKKILLLSIAFTLALTSCEEMGLIGLDMLESQAGILKTDTFTIVAFSQPEDSVPTSLIRQGVVGLVNDPIFGKFRSSLFADFRLHQNNISLGEEPVLDSIVLMFNYSGYYGDTLTRQTVRIHELLENIPDTVIYSNYIVEYDPDPIVEKRIMPRPYDSLMIDGRLLMPHVRFRLSDDFGNRIISQNGTPSFENNTNFREFFKGLYITVDDHNEAGAFSYYDILNVFSKLSLYYKDVAVNDTAQLIHHFFINQYCSRYNYFENFNYEYADEFLQQQLKNEDSLSGDSLLYIHGLQGVRVNYDIPYLTELIQTHENITLNRAKLYVPVDEEYLTEGIYKPPRTLLLLAVNEEGEFQSLPDSQLGAAIYGGTYNESKKSYEFYITNHIQSVINGSYPTGTFILRGANPSENANRVVLRGPGRSENNMRLEITFTNF